MFDKEKFFRQIKEVHPGTFNVDCEELFALASSGAPLTVAHNAFRFGFLKGQRCERAAAKKKVGKDNG